MKGTVSIIILLVGLNAVLNVEESRAKPVLSRIKRVSDQRLAELETLIALDKLKGKLITVPVGIGLDPNKIGRKRRADASFLQNLFNASEEDSEDALLKAEEAELAAETEAKSALLYRLQRLQQLRRHFTDLTPSTQSTTSSHLGHRLESVRNSQLASSELYQVR